VKFIIHHLILIHSQNLEKNTFDEFLKEHYRTFESHSFITFKIKTDDVDELARLAEAMIHRYCRAIGYDSYEIKFINENCSADKIYKTKKARD
jgi:hypothetical protein